MKPPSLCSLCLGPLEVTVSNGVDIPPPLAWQVNIFLLLSVRSASAKPDIVHYHCIAPNGPCFFMHQLYEYNTKCFTNKFFLLRTFHRNSEYRALSANLHSSCSSLRYSGIL